MFTGGDGYTVFTQGTNVKFTGDLMLDVVQRVHDRPLAGRPGGRGPHRRAMSRSPTPASSGRDGRGARPFRRFRRTIVRVTPELASALAKLPDKPGVYLMKDARGDVVYVGKAQSLRNRVRSYWQKQAPGRRGPPDPERHRPGRRRRGHPDRLGLGGAPPRGEPDQALPAALQRPAQGRQELPVHQGHARRRLPAGRADAQAGQRRQPLLRAVRARRRASTNR